MFHEPEEYNATNYIPRRTAHEALEDYHRLLKYEENNLILEVGSGSGNVTAEVLLPYIGDRHFRLVGVDLQHMIDFANNNNKDQRLTFRVLDITEKHEHLVKSVFTDEELKLGFNLVFSFNCLHWTQDYPQCFKNIFACMKPGGQMFVLLVAYSAFGEIWSSVHELEKWQPMLKDVPVFTFPYHYSEDPIKECTDLLKEIGFEDIRCFLERKQMLPENHPHPPPPMDRVMEFMDPYLHVIPVRQRADYMSDVMTVYNEVIAAKPGLPYDRLMVIASKPHK